ncbi:MAG TPA: ROK family protein, partial [Terriglobia bacterium]|nr:ROK family protein [Terriglobia bacterium]
MSGHRNFQKTVIAGQLMGRCALVVDLGGTKIAVARVEDTGRVTHQRQAPTPPAGGMAVVESIVELLRRLPAKGAVAIGIGVPGLAYPDGVVWAPNLRGWERMPLGELLGRRFHLPVVVDSDRNAFVTGEAWQGSAKRCRDVVFVAIGTGIGAGIISGGRLIRGFGELAGCLGWMAVHDRFLPEYRAVGCLEFHAAGPGIAREARRVFHQPLEAREVVTRARAGDAAAVKVIAQAGHFLGLGLANLVDILNPQMIVIGGGVAGAGNLLLEPAQETM